MKYNVIYSCGHEAEAQLFGPMKERERKIEWMKTQGLCPDCYRKQQAEKKRLEEERHDGAIPEGIVTVPEDRTKEGIVKIFPRENEIIAEYRKDDDFRSIVKELGYSWDPESKEWKRKIGKFNGNVKDRAAELGNRLLTSGFAVAIPDSDAREMAVNGTYEPEWRRWITVYQKGSLEGWFCIKLTYGDGMYEKARQIKGSRYNKPSVSVPADEWESVEEFADLYDYRLSDGAKALIAAKKAAVTVVHPVKGRENEYHEKDVSDILTSSRDVLDDLRDD